MTVLSIPPSLSVCENFESLFHVHFGIPVGFPIRFQAGSPRAWPGCVLEFLGGPRPAVSRRRSGLFMVATFFLTHRSGFFVIAPNLLGHAWRQGNDYRVSALAEDLLPYFGMDTSYDVIIGHSLGATVTLSLLPFLPKTKETTVVLLDPPLEVPTEHFDMLKDMFLKEAANTKSVDEWMAENPSWSRRDCVLRIQGLSVCGSAAIKGILQVNVQV